VDDRLVVGEGVDQSGDGPIRWTRVAVVAFVVDLAVLAATGVWLSWNFRPTAASVWRDLYGGPAVDWPAVMTALHRWSAVVLVFLAVVAVGVALVRLVDARMGPLPLMASLVAVGAALGGWFTGSLLPWDQVALWAVTVGTNMGGYWWLWSDEIRFVFARGREVPVEDVQRAFLLHLALFAVIVAVALVGWLVRRRRAERVATAT
jgi:quinol-cytochrome oxidoreductase complex cytochrome b subunit